MESIRQQSCKIEFTNLQPIPIETVNNWKEVPVKECGEKLVPVGAFSSFSNCDTSAVYFGERGEGKSMNFLGKPVDRRISLITHFVREGILKKIELAQESLPEGNYFRFFDNYRTLEVQQKLFDEQKEIFRLEHPEWDENTLDKETQRFVSFPSLNKERGTTHPSPHNTGGVIDLTIIKLTDEGQRLLKELENQKKTGGLDYEINPIEERQKKVVEKSIDKEAKESGWSIEYTKQVKNNWLADYRYSKEKARIFKEKSTELDMGTKFDYFGKEAGIRYYEELEKTRELTPEEKERQKNRRFFYKVMKNAGFSNYHEEWWHYCSGDGMDAVNAGKPYAIYGGIELSEENKAFDEARARNYRREVVRRKKESKALFLNSSQSDPTSL